MSKPILRTYKGSPPVELDNDIWDEFDELGDIPGAVEGIQDGTLTEHQKEQIIDELIACGAAIRGWNKRKKQNSQK